MLKPTGSDDYHQIIDFLRASHIRSPELGPLAIQATIDKTPYTITEDLVRSQLQLADDGGIDDLPIAKIYFGMDNLGKLFTNMRLNFEGHHIPLLAAMLSQDQEVFEHGQSSDPNIASFSRTHETDADLFTNVEDEPLGGSFHMSPPRSTQAPPAGCGGKVGQEGQSNGGKAQDHKKKMDVSDSDQEERGKQDVDSDALLALANAAVTIDSNISPGGASDNLAASTSVPADVPTSVNVPTGSTSVPADVPTSVTPAGVSNKRKTPMVEEDINVKEMTFKRMQKDRLGEQAEKRLHDEEQAHVDRQRAEVQRRRQQEVLASAMYYTEADWINIMAQVEANASLSKTLLGDDVFEDNFLARMAALIKRKQQALAKKLAKEMRNRPMTQGQQRTYTTLKRTGPVLEEPSPKRQKYTEAPIPSVPKVPQSLVVSSPKSSGTKRKSLGRKRLPQPKSKLKELDLDADAQTFIKVVSNEDSDDEAPILWSALVGWEVITTPLGDINALYRIDRSTKHFTTLRQILYMVDRHDLVKLYGLVVKYYEHHPVAGAELILWGDL
nr:hypothetical protein [Tanacetum cinerariifolium]